MTQRGSIGFICILLPLLSACSDASRQTDADADALPDIGQEDVMTDPDAAGDPDGSSDAGDPSSEDVTMDEIEREGPPAGTCPGHGNYALYEGLNAGFMSNGKAREFMLFLPDTIASAPGPWPLIFSWHCLGCPVSRATALIEPFVSDERFKFIGVAPVGRHMSLPDGFEWDMLVIDPEDNDDLQLFDDLLACIDEAFGVDPDRVHSLGFSAGAIMTDLLFIARGDLLASTVAFSGAFFSDPNQRVNPSIIWPAYALDNKLTPLIVFGGQDDVYAPFVNFSESGLFTIPYLNDLGHDVIACHHALDHQIPPELAGGQAIEFFKDHPMGSHPTPYSVSGLPDDFPSYCAIHPASE